MFDYKQILQLLGGHRALSLMVGAKDFVYSDTENFLRFRIGGGASNGINLVKVTYCPGLDMYEIEFGRIHKLSYTVVESYENVYGDMLSDIFESTTGFTLSIPRLQR